MFQNPLKGARQALAALRTTLLFNAEARSHCSRGAPLPFALRPPLDDWRRLDYSTAVTRLYQVFESFIHECITEWVRDLCQMARYQDLPEGLKNTYCKGLGFVLQNLDQGKRFKEVTLVSLIREYNGALSNETPYRLHSDAFLIHSRNLRVNELHKLFSDCGLNVSLPDWLKNHRISKDESLELIGHNSVEKCLDSLVDLRNEASHATRKVSEIVGETVLIGYVDFIDALCRCIAEALTKAALLQHTEHGNWITVGRVNQVISSNRHTCVAAVDNCSLKVGASALLVGKYYSHLVSIEEIWVDNVIHQEYSVGSTGREIGFRFSGEASKNAEIYTQTVAIQSPVQQTQLPTGTVEIGEEVAVDNNEDFEQPPDDQEDVS